MCGRYYVDDETAREIEKLVKEMGSRERWSRLPGDIHPAEEALEDEEVPDWLLEEEKFRGMICQRDVALKRRQEYEQQTLPV